MIKLFSNLVNKFKYRKTPCSKCITYIICRNECQTYIDKFHIFSSNKYSEKFIYLFCFREILDKKCIFFTEYLDKNKIAFIDKNIDKLSPVIINEKKLKECMKHIFDLQIIKNSNNASR